MRVILTSCGLETETIKARFIEILDKKPSDVKALFIPTAAIDADAIGVLPKCMNDLLKCGIAKESITVFDLHRNMSEDELKEYDVVYLTGGNTTYLLNRINDTGFRDALMNYIRDNGIVLGVSAGSLIFADSLPDNLGLLDIRLDVHCEDSSCIGKTSLEKQKRIRLSNTAAMIIKRVPDDIEIIDA